MQLHQPHYVEAREGRAHLNLGGTWQYTFADSQVQQPGGLTYGKNAQIPNSLFWNLYESGTLPYPYQGLNSKQYHWVDEKVWYYRRSFGVEAALRGTTAILCFDGAAYYSRIWLNGELLGEHEGMFGGPYVNVSDRLHYGGENELIVEIRACNWGKKDTYDGRNLHGDNREIVPWNIARDDHTSNGDWIIMGLWRAVRLEFLAPTHLARPYLVTKQLEEGSALLRLEVEVVGPDQDELHPAYGTWDEEPDYTFAYAQGLTEKTRPGHAVLTVRMTEKSTGACALERSFEFDLLDANGSLRANAFPESQFIEREFRLDHPHLWWPHDMGEPFLYETELILTVDGTLCDRLSFNYGVRTVQAVRTQGPRARERWDPFQFVINGRKIFLKGVNWMPQDALYREDREEYEWSLHLVRSAGIQLVRVWSGGGTPESDAFYDLCDTYGILVWQDHFIANTSHTEGWPQDVLEAQESVNLYRIRCHPSLAVHCGGNEFNAYSAGNAASMFVIDRTIRTLDPDKIWYYTTPDRGSAHIYRDMEPIWYRHLYKDLPFVAETGIHSLPSYKALCACLNETECSQEVPDMTSPEFRKLFPELLNHFAEYVPERVPRMLSRASQIEDLQKINLEGMAEATQIASCEYYEILTQSLRENYPRTAGLMPWVFRRTWTTVGIQLVDGFGEPIAPYYYLKNAYRPLEAHLALEQVSFAPGEKVKVPVRICNEYGLPLENCEVEVSAWSPEMKLLWKHILPARRADGTVLELETKPEWTDCFFFFTVTLRQDGQTVARQAYWPKCLSLLADEQLRTACRAQPQENFLFQHGPWLKKQVAQCDRTSLELETVRTERRGRRVTAELRITNTGNAPAFPVNILCTGEGIRGMAQDNWFWLEAGETRLLHVEMDAANGKEPGRVTWKASAWNADAAKTEV